MAIANQVEKLLLQHFYRVSRAQNAVCDLTSGYRYSHKQAKDVCRQYTKLPSNYFSTLFATHIHRSSRKFQNEKLYNPLIKLPTSAWAMTLTQSLLCRTWTCPKQEGLQLVPIITHLADSRMSLESDLRWPEKRWGGQLTTGDSCMSESSQE